jgi:hypothetical protein
MNFHETSSDIQKFITIPHFHAGPFLSLFVLSQFAILCSLVLGAIAADLSYTAFALYGWQLHYCKQSTFSLGCKNELKKRIQIITILQEKNKKGGFLVSLFDEYKNSYMLVLLTEAAFRRFEIISLCKELNSSLLFKEN